MSVTQQAGSSPPALMVFWQYILQDEELFLRVVVSGLLLCWSDRRPIASNEL